MKPEEMPVELLTEPITHFGLYADMLPFSVIPESEWIIVDMSIQRPTIVQSYFRSQRRCGGSPTEEITLTAIFCAVPVKQIADNNIIIIIFRILFIYLSNYVRISTKYIFYNSNRFIRPIYFLSIIITF